MSYVCTPAALVSADLNADGVLDESEFLEFVGDCGTFNFERVGCRCVDFNFGGDDDGGFGVGGGVALPEFCRADCSVIPLSGLFVNSQFLSTICEDLYEFWLAQNCIETPTASPTLSISPTSTPTQFVPPTAPTIVPLVDLNGGNGKTVVIALLGVICLFMGLGLIFQFVHFRRIQKDHEAYRKKQERIAQRKRLWRDNANKRPFQPVLGRLMENDNGEMVMTPTNLPPDETIMRCSLQVVNKKTPTTLFATSITIESLSAISEQAKTRGDGLDLLDGSREDAV